MRTSAEQAQIRLEEAVAKQLQTTCNAELLDLLAVGNTPLDVSFSTHSSVFSLDQKVIMTRIIVPTLAAILAVSPFSFIIAADAGDAFARANESMDDVFGTAGRSIISAGPE